MKTYQRAITIIIFTLSFLSIFPTHKALAHDTYFLRVLVNENSMLYEGLVELDKIEKKQENQHAELKLGRFQDMATSVSTEFSAYSTGNQNDQSIIPNMPFSFPSKQVESGARGVNHATDKDAERAYAISNVLIPNLNEMLVIINNGKQYTDINTFQAASKAIIAASNGVKTVYNGWTLSPNAANGEMTVYQAITDGQMKNVRKIQYSMKKYEIGALEGDAVNINVGMLAGQGLYSMEVKKLTTSNIDEENKPNLLESTISTLISSFTGMLRSILGTYSIDELVFNNSPRMKSGYVHGVMKQSWMDIAVSFHIVFQVLAWLSLIFAALKIMFDKTLSTFSVFKQISMINSVKNLIITGFLLGSSFLLLQALLVVNKGIVDIFTPVQGSFSNLGGATMGGTNNQYLAYAFLSIYYFIIELYLNFVYILRALTIAILIASAPLFIVSTAFSTKGSEMFGKWARELIANIFTQSMHAFILGMMLSIQLSANRIEIVIVSIALIPITKMFKKLVVGESGGVLGDVAGGVASAGAGFAAGSLSKGKGGGGGGSSNGSEIPGSGSHPERKEHSVDVPSKEQTNSTLSSAPEGFGQVGGHTATASNGLDAGTSRNPKMQELTGEETWKVSPGNTFGKDSPGMNGAETASSGEEDSQSKWAGAYEKAKPAIKEGVKSAGRVLGGAAMVGAGVAVGAALGAVAGPQGFKAAEGLVKKGGGQAFGEIKNKGSQAMDYMKHSKSNDTQSLMGSERLSNGNIANHRNRKVMQDMGYEDAFSTQKEIGIKYNPNNLSADDSASLAKIQNLDPDKWAEKGIDNVTEGADGMTTVHYNNYGKNQLGMRDIYSTKSKFVETKGHLDSPDTRFIYDVDSVKSQKSKDGYKA